MKESIFSSWKQECQYLPFADKALMKELADKDMILRQRAKP